MPNERPSAGITGRVSLSHIAIGREYPMTTPSDEFTVTVGDERFDYLRATPARRAAPELLAMLRRLEWSATDECGDDGWCPVCGGHEPVRSLLPESRMLAGHFPDCELDALLARAAATP